jgi:hypothetical protein
MPLLRLFGRAVQVAHKAGACVRAKTGETPSWQEGARRGEIDFDGDAFAELKKRTSALCDC